MGFGPICFSGTGASVEKCQLHVFRLPMFAKIRLHSGEVGINEICLMLFYIRSV